MKSITFFIMALAMAVLAIVGVYGEWGEDSAHAQGAGPPAPTNVRATATGSAVTVSWTDSPTALGHLVFLFRADFTGDALDAAPTGSSHTFNGVPDGSYIAVAVAFDASGDYNYAISGVVTVSAGGTGPQPTPGATATPQPTPTPTPTTTPADQPPCPMPGSPAAAESPPRPTSSTPGDYDADDDGLIEVANLVQLDAIRYDLSGTGTPSDDDLESYYTAFPNAVAGMGCPADGGCAGYELVADLNFGANPINWLPIGRYDPETGEFKRGFAGTFDGNHHTISNLFIDRKDQDNVGLFGSSHGTIRNVGLISVNVAGRSNVGGLVGGVLFSHDDSIAESYATGAVSGGGNNLGGLVGQAGVSITGSCAAANVSGDGDGVGGLVGGGGIIRDSYATGDVSGGDNVGGLVGHGYNTSGRISITGSYATGAVSGERSSAGGLLGSGLRNNVTITDSYATGDVSGGSSAGGLVGSGGISITGSHAAGDVSGGSSAGGLVGSGGISITGSYATGDVSGYIAGGLFGSSSTGRGGSITGSYATGDVSGEGNVGGLVGQGDRYHDISDSYATGDVSGGIAGGLVGARVRSITGSYATGDVSGNSRTGGLVGYIGSTITNSYVTGNVSGAGDDVGGLVGLGRVTITNSYVTGNVSGAGDDVGGLVGDGDGNITGSYATGDVSGGGDNVGGLVGRGGSITSSYATGDVSGGGNNVGGLVGSGGNVTAGYATGNVSGNFRVGGLVGQNGHGNIVASYAIGQVRGKGEVGGLVGSNTGTVTDSYWDTTASGAQHSDGGTGKTTAELQAPTGYAGIYANWNVNGDDPWDFGTSSQYPVLKYGGLSVASQRGAASRGG